VPAYNNQSLTDIFKDKIKESSFLDFSPPESLVQGLAISSRELAIEKGLNLNDLDSIAGVQGLPPLQILKSLIEQLDDAHLIPDLHGLGIELGAGLALLSIVLLERDTKRQIDGILALEAVKPFVERGIQKAGAEILGERKGSLLPCFGIFESIPVADETFDFALQIESLHHAEDLGVAVKELSRILKIGGVVFSLDRSWISSTKREVLDQLLNHEYSKEWLAAKHFPLGNRFTRRDNGEHEYTDQHWIETFRDNGLVLKRIVHLNPQIEMWHVKKRLVTCLKLTSLLGVKIESRKGILRSWFNQTLKRKPKIHSNLMVSPHPRPLTLFVFAKE